MTLYRLPIIKQPTEPKAEAGLLSIWKYVSDPILEMRSDHITPGFYHSKAFIFNIDWDNWKKKAHCSLRMFISGSLMVLRLTRGQGLVFFGLRPNRSFSFPLGKFATDFQNEIYAILQCAYENIRRTYKNRRSLIFSEIQAALKALCDLKVTSGMFAQCLDAISTLAALKNVTLVCVPWHRGISGNEDADKLARQASAMLLLGPEPALELPKCSVRKPIRTGLRCNVIQPRKICQASDKANYL